MATSSTASSASAPAKPAEDKYKDLAMRGHQFRSTFLPETVRIFAFFVFLARVLSAVLDPKDKKRKGRGSIDSRVSKTPSVPNLQEEDDIGASQASGGLQAGAAGSLDELMMSKREQEEVQRKLKVA